MGNCHKLHDEKLTSTPSLSPLHDTFLDLGCVAEVVGFKVTNTHNHIWNDYSTKNFSVYLRWNIKNKKYIHNHI